MLKTPMKLGMSAYLRHPNSRANSVDKSGYTFKEKRKKECILKGVFGGLMPTQVKEKVKKG